jgi:glycogen debranching enzyme
MKTEAAKLFEAMFNVATHQDLRRLPELFCGFLRKRNRGPTSYPVACSPQAWAAATFFGFLAACLGLQIRNQGQLIELDKPLLPEFIDGITIKKLGLDQSVDLNIVRSGAGVDVEVLDARGSMKVSILK